ncbi:MAG: hypothetical protein AB1649_14945 [Chloroflexota bacterium]
MQQPPISETKSGPRWWVWVIVVILACCCLTCAGLIAFVAYFSREPEGISVDYSMPSVVHVGENFDLVLTITNASSQSVTVNDIDLDEYLGGSILDGAVVLETEPAMPRDYSLEGVKTFSYNRAIEPGETAQVVFHLQATVAGEFGGSVGVYVGDISKRIDYIGIVVQP